MVAKTTKSTTKIIESRLVRTVRGVKSFRRAGLEFTREPRLLTGKLSKARIKAIEEDPRLEFIGSE